MATYFSKVITERDTGDYEFFSVAMTNHNKYLHAFELYEALAAIDEYAVKKVREITPVIAAIQPEYFEKVGLIVPKNLVEAFLKKF